MLALGVIIHFDGPDHADAELAARFQLGDFDYLLGPRADGHAVHRATRSNSAPSRPFSCIATMLRLALNLASTRLILAEGHHRNTGRGQSHPGLRRLRDERQFRHRPHRLRDFGDRQFRRHHQRARAASQRCPRASASTPCPASKWRSMPICRPGLIDEAEKRAPADDSSRTKAPSSAPWTARPSSSEATPSPAF